MIISDLIIIICLILSAFFSGMEIAFVSSNKIYLEIEKQQSGINAKVLNFITKNPSRFIATMLVGNNICLLYTSPSPRDRQKSRMPASA